MGYRAFSETGALMQLSGLCFPGCSHLMTQSQLELFSKLFSELEHQSLNSVDRLAKDSQDWKNFFSNIGGR